MTNMGLWTPATETMATDEEYARAEAKARHIIEVDSKRGWKVYFAPPKGETLLDVNTRGYLAEIIAARMTGLPLNDRLLTDAYRGKRKPHDIGQRTEVRNARNHRGPLYLHPSDPDDRIGLLVTGSGRGPYVLRGWIEVALGKSRDNWDDSIPYPAFVVPASRLRPLPLPPDA